MSEHERLAKFLDEAARYFEKRDTHGEDSAYWANVLNGANCREAAIRLRSAASRIERLESALRLAVATFEDMGLSPKDVVLARARSALSQEETR